MRRLGRSLVIRVMCMPPHTPSDSKFGAWRRSWSSLFAQDDPEGVLEKRSRTRADKILTFFDRFALAHEGHARYCKACFRAFFFFAATPLASISCVIRSVPSPTE